MKKKEKKIHVIYRFILAVLYIMVVVNYTFVDWEKHVYSTSDELC